MTGHWKGSDRKGRLPSNWTRLRKTVLVRDKYQCNICGSKATEVDHVIPGDDHSLRNLRAVCSGCHRKKSSLEGVSARQQKRELKKRPREGHPGLRKSQE